MMKSAVKLKAIGVGLTLSFMAVACNPEARQDANQTVDEAQTNVTAAAADADDSYDDFSGWVRTNANKAENATAQEWNEIEAEHDRREAALDAKSDTWDDKTKEEWQQLKNNWKETRAKAKNRLDKVDVDVDVDTH